MYYGSSGTMIVVWVTCCMNTALILYAVKDNKEWGAVAFGDDAVGFEE